MPIAVLFGTHDRILDPQQHGEALGEMIPTMQLEWVEGAGHMLPLTVPDRVAHFVASVAARAG
jgi:pimeloyl-ACP methyl ester carboxylesterase